MDLLIFTAVPTAAGGPSVVLRMTDAALLNLLKIAGK
jgi:hypothetical protein